LFGSKSTPHIGGVPYVTPVDEREVRRMVRLRAEMMLNACLKGRGEGRRRNSSRRSEIGGGGCLLVA
jgi:hypothetical protein